MKKYFLYRKNEIPILTLGILLLFYSCAIEKKGDTQTFEAINQEDNKSNSTSIVQSDLDRRLSIIREKFEDGFFLSILSLETTRNLRFWDVVFEEPKYWEWESLEGRVSSFTDEEKKSLIKSLSNKIEKSNMLPDTMLSRIEYWCLARNAFISYSKEPDFYFEKFITYLYEIEILKNLIDKEILQKGQQISGLSSYQMNELYFKILNLISGLKETEQDEIFNRLRTAISN